jgi:hypothetical protein
VSIFDSAWSVLKAESYRVRFPSGPRGTPREISEGRYLRNLFKTSMLEGKLPASDERLTPEQMMQLFGVERLTPEMLGHERDKKGNFKQTKDGKGIPLNPEIFERYKTIRDNYIKKIRQDFRSNPQKYGATASFPVGGQDEVKANKRGDFSGLDNTTVMNPPPPESSMGQRLERMLANFNPTNKKEVNKKAHEVLRNLGYEKYKPHQFAAMRDHILGMHPNIETKEKPAPVDNTSTASRVASNLRTNPILPKDGDNRQTTLGDFGESLQAKPILPEGTSQSKTEATELPSIEEMVAHAEKLKQVADANEKEGKDVTAQDHLKRLDDLMEQLEDQGVDLDQYTNIAQNKLGIKEPLVPNTVKPAKRISDLKPEIGPNELPFDEDGNIDTNAMMNMFSSGEIRLPPPPKNDDTQPEVKRPDVNMDDAMSVLGLRAGPAQDTTAPAPQLTDHQTLVQRLRSQMVNDPTGVERFLDDHKGSNEIDDHIRLLGDIGHMGRISDHLNIPIQQYSQGYQRVQENPEMYGLSSDASAADIHNHIVGMFDPELAY